MLRALCLVLTASLVTVAAPSAPAIAAEAERGPRSVALEGRGFGHGRGMSQYGANERAEGGQDHRQILRFYYPGTDLGRARGLIRVLITADTSDDVVVRHTRGLAVRRVGGAGSWDLGGHARAERWRLTPADGGSSTRVSAFTNRWRSVRVIAGEAEFSAGSRALTLVTPAGATRYQGALRSAIKPGGRDTVNSISLDNYLRGVVPREVPALWHREAVKAQAVAARTYAAYHRAQSRTDYYDLCDTTSCQVYGGVGDSHPASDAAIRATSREVLRAGGEPAFTEFSSSNGGWTVAGSVPYQVAKQDTWDPVNRWSYRLPAATIENTYPGIGDFRRLRVLRRDGHGQWNGRVLRIRVIGSAGRVTRTGEEFRITFALRSTWFRAG